MINQVSPGSSVYITKPNPYLGVSASTLSVSTGPAQHIKDQHQWRISTIDSILEAMGDRDQLTRDELKAIRRGMIIEHDLSGGSAY